MSHGEEIIKIQKKIKNHESKIYLLFKLILTISQKIYKIRLNENLLKKI
jgi:hypothetical protein